MLGTGDWLRQARHRLHILVRLSRQLGAHQTFDTEKTRQPDARDRSPALCPIRGERSRQQDTEATRRLLQAPWSPGARPLDGMAPSGDLTAAGPVGLLPAASPV